MHRYLLAVILVLFGLFILCSGCTEPPIKEPTVTVSDISLSNISFQAVTVNTTVIVFNPNPVGARLNRVAFDVYWLGDTWNYLGHGEQTGIEVTSNGNTSVMIPVTISTLPAIGAVGSLVSSGSLDVKVNGSAFIDVKVTSFEKRFEQNRVINASDVEGLLPVAALPETSVNVTGNLQQIGAILGSVT